MEKSGFGRVFLDYHLDMAYKVNAEYREKKRQERLANARRQRDEEYNSYTPVIFGESEPEPFDYDKFMADLETKGGLGTIYNNQNFYDSLTEKDKNVAENATEDERELLFANFYEDLLNNEKERKRWLEGLRGKRPDLFNIKIDQSMTNDIPKPMKDEVPPPSDAPPDLPDVKMLSQSEAEILENTKERRSRAIGSTYVQRMGSGRKELYVPTNFDNFWNKLNLPYNFSIQYNHNYLPNYNIWEGEGKPNGGWKYGALEYAGMSKWKFD